MSVRSTMRRSWPVLLSYGLFSMWGVGCLFASLMLTSGGFGMSPGDLGVLGGVLVSTVVGHILGNVLGLAGLRLMPVAILFFGLFIGTSLSGVVLGPVALFLVLALFAAVGGYLGIASRLDVVAAWYPLSFAIGGAIHWMNHHGAVATFRGGAKHALWDPFTLVCLTGTVFLMLTFLATRHSLGLTVWQEVARPRTAEPSGDPIAVARPGRGSVVVLFGFTLVVLGATALISPYLFRTKADDGSHGGGDGSSGGEGSSGGKQGQGSSGSSGGKQGQGSSGSSGGKQGQGSSGSSGGKQGQGSSGQQGTGSGGAGGEQGTSSGASGGEQGTSSGASGGEQGASSGASGGKQGSSGGSGSKQGSSGGGSGAEDPPIGKPDTKHAGNAAGEALDLGMKVFLGLLIAAALLLVLLLLVFPPIRRAFLIRHLERPLWPVSPTSRVMNLWRRALAALAALDIEPAPGESVPDFAVRARAELGPRIGCDAPGLVEAAAIVDRIHYAGRGLGAGDEQMMRDAVSTFVRIVDSRVGAKKKLFAAWGRPPEVES